MEDLIAQLNDFVQRNVMWAAPILGLITFGESLVFIGAFFPATALMVTAGGLIGAGILNPIPVLLWCIAGATLGDAVSYWIGRRVGPSAWRHPWLKKHRRPLARARLFFRHYGVASIFLCRFMGPVRAFVPLIAGMTTMNQVKFQLANFFSAVVWVPVMIAPGWLVAAGLTQFGSLDDHLHTIGVVATVALVVTAATLIAWKLISKKLIREGA
ncbi:MAG: DedA family protein [Brevundimonas sp.]|uniref:DedA family protein n=1 Tax=Brevundimonas sp. TaxID=1871086 RepID=UPI00391B645D